MQDKIELTVRRYYSQKRIDKNPLVTERNLNPDNFETYLWTQLEDYDAMGIRHIYLVATKEEIMAKYPKDWWQAIKDRWMPKVLARWFPIKYITIIALHKFPHWEKQLGQEYVQIIYKEE